MGISFSDKEWDVFCNIISGVESGGQIYGNGDWGDVTEAYANSQNEVAITIGCYQFYGVEAHQVVALIQSKYPAVFRKYDNAGLAADLKKSDWSNYQISKSSAKAIAIKNMISTDEGIKCQKEVFKTNSQKLLEYAYSLGITDHKALAMGMNLAHLGGTGALKRVISKTNRPYTVNNIDAALRTDDQGSAQVGARMFRSRHDCVIRWLNKYWPNDSSSSSSSSQQQGGKSMAKTYPAGYISNSGHDENNSYYGGRAGDQTGTEWELRAWYNRPWDYVLRYPDANVRRTIAELAIEGALNDCIGYDQYERTTFWYQLAKVGYRPKNITVNCESDCSAGATACCKAAGYLHNIAGLKNLSPDNYTGSMVAAFRAAGFEILSGSKYTSSSNYILAGDVLLNEAAHAAICISSGALSGEGPTTYDGTSVSSSGSASSDNSLNTSVKYYVYAAKTPTALRTWAGVENSKLKSFPEVNKNQKLGVCDSIKADDGSTWYFVKIEDKYGFVAASDVSEKELPTSNSANNVQPSGDSIVINGVNMTISDGESFNTKTRKWIGRNIANSLNCRQWAGTDSDLLISVPKIKKGTKVYVYDVLLDDYGHPWLFVKIKNPTTGKYVWGFVYAAYIEKI